MPSAILKAIIEADTTRLTSGLDKAMKELRSFLTLGALAAAARQAIAYGSAINDIATKSGVGVKWLQATAYAAKLAGSSLEELSNALIELRRAQAQALGGSASDVSAFAQLGISMDSLRSSSPEALFDRVADAVKRTNGGLQETNAALQVLGRGGKGLLAGMVDGFSESRQAAYDLGLVLEESTIKAMDELGDRLDTLKLGFTAFTAEVLKNMMSLNNWSHFAQVLNEAFQAADVSAWVRAALKGGPGAVVTELSSRLGKINGSIVDSYMAGEDSTDRPGKKGSRDNGVMAPLRIKPSGAVNELARMGGYVGGTGISGNPLLHVQNQALSELRKMRQFLDRMSNRSPGETVTW